jgi:hypothetical protein
MNGETPASDLPRGTATLLFGTSRARRGCCRRWATRTARSLSCTAGCCARRSSPTAAGRWTGRATPSSSPSPAPATRSAPRPTGSARGAPPTGRAGGPCTCAWLAYAALLGGRPGARGGAGRCQRRGGAQLGSDEALGESPATLAAILAERDDAAGFVAIELSDLGAVAAARGGPERAARLWGASDALHCRLGGRPLLIEAMVRSAFSPQVQCALGPERFEAERGRGEALPVEAALALALALAEPGDIAPIR